MRPTAMAGARAGKVPMMNQNLIQTFKQGGSPQPSPGSAFSPESLVPGQGARASEGGLLSGSWIKGGSGSGSDLFADYDVMAAYEPKPSADELASTGESQWQPVCDVRQSETEMVVEMDVPGVAAGTIRVECNRGWLCVSGTRAVEHFQNTVPETTGRFIKREIAHGAFVRRLRLPPGTKVENVAHQIQSDGVLLVTVRMTKDADAILSSAGPPADPSTTTQGDVEMEESPALRGGRRKTVDGADCTSPSAK